MYRVAAHVFLSRVCRPRQLEVNAVVCEANPAGMTVEEILKAVETAERALGAGLPMGEDPQ